MIRVATVGTLLSLAIALGWAPATQARAGAEAPRATIGSSAPLDPARLVATSRDSQRRVSLLFSADSGRTWTAGPEIRLTTESRRYTVAQFEGGPWMLGDGGTLLAAFGDRLQRSVDGGQTWTPARPLPDTSSVFDVTVDPLRPAEAWFCERDVSSGESWLTTDAGATWTERGGRGNVCRPQAIQPAASHVLLVSDAVGSYAGALYRSTDDGRRWSRVRGTSTRFSPSTPPAFDPRRPRVAVVAAGDMLGVRQRDQLGRWSIWRTTDAGLTWRRVWRVPTRRCNARGTARCGAYELQPKAFAVGDGRFVLGPLTHIGTSVRGVETSRGAVYAMSSGHGRRWRLVPAPYATRGKSVEELPQTDRAVATADGVVAQESPRSRAGGRRFWRLRPGATRWVSEPFRLAGAGSARAAASRGRVDPGDGGKVVNPDGTTTWRSTGCRHRKATRSSTLSWLCLTVTGPPTVTEGEPVTYVYKAHVRRPLEKVALKIHVGGLRGWQWKRKYPVLRKGRTITKTLTSTPKILDYGDGVRGTETYLQATVKRPEQFGTIGSTGILPAAP